MSLRQKIPMMLEHINSQQHFIKHNSELFDIYEGDLLTHLKKDLADQLSPDSYKQILSRVAPINVLQKLIDKLSKIYQQNPSRYVVDGSEQDKELLSWYEKSFSINKKMNVGNEFFNMFKNTLIQPYIHKGQPRLRAIPSDQFTVISEDPTDPTYPTIYITFHGERKDMLGNTHKLYYAYTDDEFLAFTSEEQIAEDVMQMLENDGTNEFGRAPFVYINKSQNLLIPKPDTDVLKMTKILPILLSDLNYAVMYQAFSLVYGINVDDENIKLNPNTFLSLKQDGDAAPSVGVIKPQVDIAEVVNLVRDEMIMWLESKGIKPGSSGTMQGDSSISAVSKIVDEMDTTDHRKKQVEYFESAEQDLWDLTFNYLHPVWASKGLIENRALFNPRAEVKTEFAEQIPLVSRGVIVSDLKSEVDAGFTTKKRAIKKLNPDMNEQEVDELLLEIEQEKTITIEEDSEDGSEEMAQGMDSGQ